MKESAYSKIFVRITAFLCILIATVIMFGWLFHIPQILQVTSTSVPVHFNSAFLFFIFGIALFCLSSRRFLSCVIFIGLLIACLGALTLAEDIFSFTTFLDEFFINDFVHRLTSSPGRMSPNTALLFFLEGLLITTVAFWPKKRWILLTAMFLGILIFCVGFSSFFGYLFDIETAYAWANLTGMSLIAAFIFCLSGVALILVSFAQVRESEMQVEEFYPFLAGALFFFQSILLSIAIEGEQANNINTLVKGHSTDIKYNIIKTFTTQGNVLGRQVTRWENRDEIRYKEWLRDSRTIIKDLPGWQYVVFVDQNLKIKWVAPSELRETLFKKKVYEEDEIPKDFYQTTESREPLMTYRHLSPTQDILNITVPVFRNKTFIGMETAGIKPDLFFEYLLQHQIDNGFVVKVVVDNQVIYASSNQVEARADFERDELFTVYGLPYKLTVTITNTLLHQMIISKASFLVLGVGIILAVLLVLYVQSFQKIRIHLCEVEKKEERFRLASKATNDILWDWNFYTDQFLMSENIKLFGYELQAQESNRKWWFEHVHPEDQNKLSDSIKNSINDKLPFWTCEYRFARSDGSYASILDRAYILYDEDNQPMRAIGAMMDVTERKVIERRKNEFISTVSHELRTPLTSIKGSLGLLLANTAGKLSEKAVQLLTISANNCDRLVRLISNILDIEKIESGRMEFAHEPIEIVGLVRESIQTNDTYTKTGVQLVFVPQMPSAIVRGDSDRLRQVLDNLLSNAMKFSPEGKQVTITIERVKDNIRVNISDEGEGIPVEFQKRIFERFSRADSPTTRLQGGTGLGLSISKAIIERLGGTINFLKRESKGTTFYFELPELKMENIKAKDEEVQKPRTTGLQILICEDDIDFAHVLKLLLEKEGATVDIAHTAAEAKDLLNSSSKKYDLLTLDLALPDQDGISLAQDLRQDERTKTLPIVVISYTGAENEQILRKKPYSILTCLDKPFSLNELKAVIDKVPRRGDVTKEPMRILHIEDEKDILDIVSALFGKEAHIEQAMTVKTAKKKLTEESFDLVLLDIHLPDGSGLSLLPCKDYKTKNVIPTIIFSASETPVEYMHFVSVSLSKSQISNEKLLQTVQTILQKGRA